MNINDLRELISLLKTLDSDTAQDNATDTTLGNDVKHPMLGRRVLVRTYSAGVHIGDLVYVNGMECKLNNALRLWHWEGGGLSLSAVANNGIKGGRLNETGEVYLTNAIEFIPTTKEAEETYVKFVEDKE